jgi:hypothetical protein
MERFSPMRFPSLLIATLALLASGGVAAAQALYAPPEADFTIAFQSPPTVQVKPAERSHDIGRRRYVDQEPTHLFMVSIDEYPDGALPQLVDAGVYDHILRDHAGDNPNRLVSTRPARLSGRPCLEGFFRNPDDTVEQIRVLMIANRIYQLAYIHAQGAEQPEAAAAFFNSFKIKPGS